MARCVAAISALLIVAACSVTRAPVQPPAGFLFANTRAPLLFDFDETPVGARHGKASVTFVQEPLFLMNLAWGDASLEEAADDGGITKIHYADYEYLSVLGLFVRFTTHVYGE